MTLLRWTPGRRPLDGRRNERAVEWVGLDASGEEVARVVKLTTEEIAEGPVRKIGRALVAEVGGQLVRLIRRRSGGEDWLACVGERVVGRAGGVLPAVRDAERALRAMRR
jgi:hypothetical protein